MLALINQHPRDLGIFFNEESHTYKTMKVASMTSVTTFIKKFFNEFDADAIISKMLRFGSSQKKYPGMSAQQIKDAWALNGKQASAKGTKLHKYIEFFFNGQDVSDKGDIEVEVEMFYKWVSNLSPKLTPFRTEWIIYDEELKIAGTIDMLFSTDPLDHRKVAIFDWKCSKEIKYTNPYGNARAPIEYLKDCNYNHYSLQLNLYKFLLEKNYNLQVVEMNLVVIHSINEKALIVPITDMQKEIRRMLIK